MDARLGLRVRFPDPENPANIINAQFATIRGNGEMKTLMEECARAEVKETVELRKYAMAAQRLSDAETMEEVDAASNAMEEANESRLKAADALVEAIHQFVVRGFELAGSTHENAEALACLVGPEQLAELRVKCSFGAGVLDFTKADAR